MLKSNASIGEVSRNSRIFLSSYPNIFNLAFFGNNSGATSFNQSGGIFDGDIHFNGTINNVNLTSGKNAYNNNDLLISTSKNESMPLVICEAMSMSLPVLSTDAGDIKKFVNYYIYQVHHYLEKYLHHKTD